MSKNVFSPSLRILIVVSLLFVVLFSGELSQKLILAAVAVWLFCMAASFLLSRQRRGNKAFSLRTAFAHFFQYVRNSFGKETSADFISVSPAGYRTAGDRGSFQRSRACTDPAAYPAAHYRQAQIRLRKCDMAVG